MSWKKIEDREIRSLFEASEELNCDDLYIVTFSEKRIIEKNGMFINVIPFKDIGDSWDKVE